MFAKFMLYPARSLSICRATSFPTTIKTNPLWKHPFCICKEELICNQSTVSHSKSYSSFTLRETKPGKSSLLFGRMSTAQTVLSRKITKDIRTKVKLSGLQKELSPLSTRRVLRRKKAQDPTSPDKIVFDGVAYATAEALDLQSLKEDLVKQGLYTNAKLPPDATNALHVEAKYKVDNETREIFFFKEGSVVFWNMSEDERSAVLQFLRRHQKKSYEHLLIEQSFDKVDYTYIDGPTQLDGDEIQLQRPESTADNECLKLEKFAFSNALSHSVKLSIWEASLERCAESIGWIVEDMKRGKKIAMSRPDVLQKTGELFELRHLINLSSDLLDTPDFYWDRDALERHYTKTSNNLNIARRTKVLNEKLTYCCELIELVREHLNDKHHTRLEWMIIILILIEVIFEIVHIVERHNGSEEST